MQTWGTQRMDDAPAVAPVPAPPARDPGRDDPTATEGPAPDTAAPETRVPEAAAPPDAADRYWTPARVVWAVVVAGLLLRAWVVLSGWFYWDDYILQARAWNLPFDGTYLGYEHDGHLMPGAFALQWPLTRAFPMSYLPLAVVLVALQCVAVWLFARAVLSEFRHSYLLVAPVAVVALSPLTLPSGTWWSAALNAVPLQIAATGSIWAFLVWRRRGGRLLAVVSVASWVLALAFFEKALLVPVALLGLAVVVDLGRGPLGALGWTLRRHWPYWLTSAALGGAYLVVNRLLATRDLVTEHDWSAVADFFSRGLLSVATTGLTGGPWSWQPVGAGSAIADPPAFLLVVAVQVTIAVVVVTVLLRPRATRAWVWFGGYLAVSLAIVAAGRLAPSVTPEIVQGLRYVADAAVPLAFALALAVVPLRGEGWSRRELRVGAWLRQRRGAAAALGLAALAAYALVSVVSTSAFRDIWAANPSREYVAGAEASLAAADPAVPVIEQSVPTEVLYGLAYPYSQVSQLLSPVSPRPPFAPQTDDLRLLDARGRLVPATVEGPTNWQGPEPQCGFRVADRDVTIPLTADVVPFQHYVRIGYLATADTTTTVRLATGDPLTVTLPRGLHAAYLLMNGGGTSITIGALSDGAQLCTDEVTVGEMVPVPGGTP